METLYGAIDDGAIAVRIPKHAKKELEAYLDCGLLCRGLARLRCERCEESRLVAFSCSGRACRRGGQRVAWRRAHHRAVDAAEILRVEEDCSSTNTASRAHERGRRGSASASSCSPLG
ncbi:transposase zinc-binding domain-containing protein [Sorangium sp. So ce854]|uniref:transposase zinc-binding domain-containing protein n=1 Tax=Sorangium sp. So ce854 TaxID=3133322 RepID=UPI003F5F6712